MKTEIEKQIDEMMEEAIEKSRLDDGEIVADAIEKAMSDESEILQKKLESTQRALEELLESIELAWEWVTNEHGERVRVVNMGEPYFMSAKREAYAVLGKKVAK